MRLSHIFSYRILVSAILLFAFSTYSTMVAAWGANGHAAVGILAVERMQTSALSNLENVVGKLDQQALNEACNWPDKVRETEKWSWTYPLHYINIPRGDFVYQESRDCSDQHCATEAIKHYAEVLADDGVSTEKRRQAFAWLCHLTGDLHQPLHAGFEDDRGGNDIELDFRGQKTNLHSIWDSGLIALHTDNLQSLIQIVSTIPADEIKADWSPIMVDSWTNESHKLAKNHVYPESMKLDGAYESRSWELIQRRISTAASRLALIINSILKPEEPVD
jgi:hypothetical protein